MGLFDFLKRKKKGEAAAESEADALLSLNDADLSGIEPSETRYTQEYQDYLAAREAAGDGESFPEDADEAE